MSMTCNLETCLLFIRDVFKYCKVIVLIVTILFPLLICLLQLFIVFREQYLAIGAYMGGVGG